MKFRCWHCGSIDGYASRARTSFEKYLLPTILLRPVRCGQCFRRSYRPLCVSVRIPKNPDAPNRAPA